MGRGVPGVVAARKAPTRGVASMMRSAMRGLRLIREFGRVGLPGACGFDNMLQQGEPVSWTGVNVVQNAKPQIAASTTLGVTTPMRYVFGQSRDPGDALFRRLLFQPSSRDWASQHSAPTSAGDTGGQCLDALS